MTENFASSTYILESSLDYALYVAENRAIPRIQDGLKDSQRRALWVIRNKSDKIKTVSLSGMLINEGSYLHGDASANAAISMLAAPYCNTIPLLHGIGAFGTRIDPVDGIGSPRYTFVKKYTATEQLVYPDLDLVPLKENYDGSLMEPVHFLPIIPLSLLNGVSGIAVGWSTEILPRKFTDLVDACIAHLDQKPIKRLVPHFERYNVTCQHLEENKWEFFGHVESVDSSTLRITELPPNVSLQDIKNRLNAMEDANTINGYLDRSTKTIDITVKMPRGSVKGWSAEQARDFFKLRQKKTERIVVIDYDGRGIRQYDDAESLVKDFVDWRLTWYTARYNKFIADDTHELRYWTAIKACFDNKLPAQLSKIPSRKQLQEQINVLCQNIGISPEQNEKIASLPIYKWTADCLIDAENRIAELQQKIADHQLLVNNSSALIAVYRDELVQLRKMKPT